MSVQYVAFESIFDADTGETKAVFWGVFETLAEAKKAVPPASDGFVQRITETARYRVLETIARKREGRWIDDPYPAVGAAQTLSIPPTACSRHNPDMPTLRWTGGAGNLNPRDPANWSDGAPEEGDDLDLRDLPPGVELDLSGLVVGYLIFNLRQLPQIILPDDCEPPNSLPVVIILARDSV